MSHFLIKGIVNVLLGGSALFAWNIAPPPEAVSAPVAIQTTSALPQSTPTSEASTTQNNPEKTSEPTTEEITGDIKVTVLSNHIEDPLPTDLEVTLFGHDQMDIVYEKVIPLSDKKTVTFEKVPFKNGRLFYAEITHKGTTYRSQIMEVNTETKILTLEINIFGTTTDTTNLVVDRMHIFLDFSQPEIINVGEVFVISNLGNKTVVPEEVEGAVLNFTIPPEATNLQFQGEQEDGRYQKTATGFIDSREIPPGFSVHEVIIAFKLPYPNNRQEFTQRMNYPTNAVVVILPEGETQIINTQLQDQGIHQVETGNIHIYTVENMNPGDLLTFTVTNPRASAKNTRHLVIGMVTFGVVILAIGIWGYYHSNREKKPTEDGKNETAEDIMDTIIALDDLYKLGEISSDTYHQRRAKLKAQLNEVIGEG